MTNVIYNFIFGLIFSFGISCNDKSITLPQPSMEILGSCSGDYRNPVDDINAGKAKRLNQLGDFDAVILVHPAFDESIARILEHNYAVLTEQAERLKVPVYYLPLRGPLYSNWQDPLYLPSNILDRWKQIPRDFDVNETGNPNGRIPRYLEEELGKPSEQIHVGFGGAYTGYCLSQWMGASCKYYCGGEYYAHLEGRKSPEFYKSNRPIGYCNTILDLVVEGVKN